MLLKTIIFLIFSNWTKYIKFTLVMKASSKNTYFRKLLFLLYYCHFFISLMMLSRVYPTLTTRYRVQKDKAEKQHQSSHWQFMCECKKHANPKIKLFELPEELINTRENVKDFIFGSASVWEKEKMRKTIFVDPVLLV